MNQFKSAFDNIPPVVKNLIIVNALLLFATSVLGKLDLYKHLGLFFITSEHFRPHQVITHMFMHGDFMHLLFNMFMLWMFGRVLEQVWGPRRFFIYYFVTGIGAALLHTAVNYVEFSSLVSQVPQQNAEIIYRDGYDLIRQNMNYSNPVLAKFNRVVNIPTVGASGAVFGVLLAFGMLFPNTQLFIIFFPFYPIKAKYVVIGMGVIELFLGFSQPGSNIAHFAHLGGMIFGYFLIKYWNKNSKTFY